MAVGHAKYRTPSPLSPEPVVRALTPRLRADAQVSVAVGSVVYWYARHLTLPPGVQAHLSSTLASMGSGVPDGVAASGRHPVAPCWPSSATAPYR
ncbi:MAG: pdc [Nocardioides sp.]|nr:pdc [Nocardioides sp.]